MAYTKTTWNNLSNPPINAENLNKIEQGIYDNSLGIDKINPSGTATTTAEIEEGQITDVIGFKSLKLKGQTSQGEDPSPDSPQEVNNVSGYNVVGIGNKNLIENETFVQGSYLDNTGTKRISCRNIKLKANTTYTFSSNLNYSTYNVGLVTSKKSFPISNGEQIYDSGWKTSSFSFTTGNDDVYANIAVKKVGELVIAPSDVSTYHFQIEQNNSATTYTAHQGNNFEINLEKNLANINDIQLQKNWQNITDTTRASIVNIPVKPNTTYSLSSSYISSSITNVRCVLFGEIGDTTHKGVVTGTFTTTSTTKYLSIEILASTTFTQSMLNGLEIQLEKGAPTSYTPYYNIELCKIGDYQDYIFKKDGKWWKHKAIGKLIFNGTEAWTSNPGITTTYVIARPTDLAQANNNVLFNYFKIVADLSVATEGARIGSSINLKNPNTADLASFKTWLGTNNVEMYYQSNTPIDEEITYAPLLRQLDELYNSGLYDVTNISQDNSSEAFILDIEACKNNINGIVEYIRR